MHLEEIAMLFDDMNRKVVMWSGIEFDDNGLLNNIMFQKDSWAMTKV